MKKTPVQLRFDAAKLKALEFYLPQTGTSVEEELQKRFDELYNNEVPQNVKDFLKFQNGVASEDEETISENGIQDEKIPDGKPAKRQKQPAPKAEAAARTEASAPVQTM